MIVKKIFIFLAVLLATQSTFAYQFPSEIAGNALDVALKTVMNDLETLAVKILFSLALLQFVITGYGQVVSGEIDASLGKFAKSFAWVAFCVWLLSSGADGLSHGGYFIKNTVDGFIKLAGSWTGQQGSSFSTTDIMLTGIQSYGNITASVAKTTSTNAVNAVLTLFVPGVALLTLMMTFAISVVVLVSCAYVALKVFMVKLELSIVIAMAPLSLAFLGLNALRDQGFAPFKSMLGLVYRIVVLGATVSAMATVSKFLSDFVDNQAYGVMADVWTPLIAAAFAFVILAFVAHKSDSIASNLASGSVSMGSGDVAGAAAMGAAAGAAMATGGAAAAGAAGKPVQSMKDMIGALKGGGGSVSNASTQGGGGGGGAGNSMGSALSLTPPPLESGAGGGGGGAASPEPTGPGGAPIPPPGSFNPGPSDEKKAYDAKRAAGRADQGAGIGGTGQNGQNSGGQQTAQPSNFEKAKGALGNLGHHISQEKAHTSVSINTHHSD